MSQTVGATRLAYTRTWHHISATTPSTHLSTIRPLTRASPTSHLPPSSPATTALDASSPSSPPDPPATSAPSPHPAPSLGRLASQVAILLMGKHKPVFDASSDCGDYVVVTECGRIRTTGKKLWQKKYYRHTTRPGSLRALTMEQLRARLGGAEVLRRAVSGMLPKNRLREPRLARLKAYEGAASPHAANTLRAVGRRVEREGGLGARVS